MTIQVVSEIEIPFPPQDVREVFFDFEHFSDIKSSLVRDIKRRPGASGPIEKGEVLDVDFGINSPVVVMKNTPTEFAWRGDFLYVLSGLHSYYFEPSKITPGHTTFRHSEIPMRVNIILMKLIPVTAMFDGFSKAFKARVETVMKGKGKALTEERATTDT